MSYASGPTSVQHILSEQHAVVLAAVDAFEAHPNVARAREVLQTLQQNLPAHFALEAKAQLPGCVCSEHASFLREAHELRPTDLSAVGQLGARLRRHILREEVARAGR